MAFYHEKLTVYRKALSFIEWTQDLFERFPKRASARDQLERASDSIVLNIAEGNGKFSNKDRGRFFQIAHGSALECSACLDVFVARKVCGADVTIAGKETLEEVVKMLCGLLSRLGIFLADEDSVGSESERQRQRQSKIAPTQIQD
jgi:four helix bundle protein